jgi:hypothetical protein
LRGALTNQWQFKKRAVPLNDTQLDKKYCFINVVLTGSTAAASCGVSENN